MEDKDLKQIKDLLKEELKPLATKEDTKNLLVDFWEGNLEPSFNTVFDQLGKVDERLGKVETDITSLNGKVAQLPTKSYLDDKIANLEGGLITKLRKEDEKINRLAEMLKDKEVLSAQIFRSFSN